MEGTQSGPPPREGPARLLLAASVRPRLAAVLTGCAILVAGAAVGTGTVCGLALVLDLKKLT